MGFTLEFLFLYFNAYDSFTRKACMKCLDSVRYEDYKLKEKAKLDQIKMDKINRLKQLQELKKSMMEREDAGEQLKNEQFM